MSETNGNGKWPLPEGWVWTTLDQTVDVLDRFRVPINGAEREQRILGFDERNLIPYFGATGQVGWIDDHLFDEELVLLGEDGAPFLDAYKDVAYIIRGKSWVNNHAHVLRAIKGLTNNSWICHYLNQFDFSEYVTGTTRLKLNQSRMNQIPIPLAPHTEQHRIVAEIEKQFTRLDAAVAALKRAKANLARYKAAVLKAAVEGRLVAQDAADEPAAALLARILAERRAQWAAANPKKQYVEPKRSDVTGLPELPVGWVWARFEQLLLSSQNGVGKRNSSIGEPTIVLRLADVVQGAISVANVRRIRLSNEEIEKYQLHTGDLLCLRVNGSPNLVGRMVSIRGFDEDVAFCDHFIRFQLVDLETSPYVSIYFESESIRKFIELNMVSSAGQNTVSQRTLADVKVPLPPITEQQRIVLEIERKFSVIQASEQVIDVNLARAERLRQGVLGKAFRGELV